MFNMILAAQAPPLPDGLTSLAYVEHIEHAIPSSIHVTVIREVRLSLFKLLP